MLHTYPPNTTDQTNDIMDTCFATAAYASKVAIHRTLNMPPGALVFQRDMILNIPLITDLLHLHERRQIIIDERLRRANLRRRTFDYKPGDQILILTNNPTTLQDRGIGPFSILQVHKNGTILHLSLLDQQKIPEKKWCRSVCQGKLSFENDILQ